MGDKYIVEIENRREQGWYRIKDFPDDWYFDETYLQKLQKYDPEKEYNRGYARGRVNAKSFEYERGYKKGLADAWKAARKIVCYPPDGFHVTTLIKIFGKSLTGFIMKSFSATEAIAKIESYEEKQKAEAEIRVGDEVELISDGTKGVVYEVVPGQVNGFYVAGRMVHFCWMADDVKKTGRHFSEVSELLEKMKEE